MTLQRNTSTTTAMSNCALVRVSEADVRGLLRRPADHLGRLSAVVGSALAFAALQSPVMTAEQQALIQDRLGTLAD